MNKCFLFDFLNYLSVFIGPTIPEGEALVENTEFQKATFFFFFAYWVKFHRSCRSEDLDPDNINYSNVDYGSLCSPY